MLKAFTLTLFIAASSASAEEIQQAMTDAFTAPANDCYARVSAAAPAERMSANDIITTTPGLPGPEFQEFIVAITGPNGMKSIVYKCFNDPARELVKRVQ